uniref:Uncharacterized protein n=1 Tax=Arundo donax TaxID=35708 RepID=A0A0A9ELH8_ARUDO
MPQSRKPDTIREYETTRLVTTHSPSRFYFTERCRRLPLSSSPSPQARRHYRTDV